MHRIVKKTIKYAGYIFLLLIIGLIVGISYLYFSADMMQPKHEPMIPLREMPYADTIIMAPAEVIYNDTLDLRFYADNFLRHSESGLWELFVKGDAFRRGEAIGTIQEQWMVPRMGLSKIINVRKLASYLQEAAWEISFSPGKT